MLRREDRPLLAVTAVLLVGLGASAAARSPGTDAGFADDILPFLERHCWRCHSEERPRGGFRIDNLSRDFANGPSIGHWLEVIEKLNTGEMPPRSEPVRPTAEASGRIAAWLSARLLEGEGTRLATRDAVSFHRLTRDEYARTIDDLLGIRFDVADPAGLNEVCAGGQQAKRSVFIYVPNGVNTLSWQIEKAGRDYELTEPLRSLEKHRHNITPISGLHHPSGVGHAHRCDKIWLTGASFEEQNGSFHNTVSADQLMAEVAGLHTRHPSLELAITGGTLAWSRDGVPLPAERKPSAVFDRLFGVSPGGVDKARRTLRRRSSVLDLVLGEANSFRRAIGSEDRLKLDEYLTAVRDVEGRTERADAWLDVPKPEVDPTTEDRLTRNIPDSEAGEYYDAVSDLMVLALRTDMTRVITGMSGSESHALAIPEIGISQTRHELSHHNGNPEQMRRLTRCDAFLTDRFSYLLDQLESIDEHGESLLDRTMVLYGSGMSYGHSHGNANLPMILAGGKGLGIEHGQHIDYNLPTIGSYDLTDPQGHYKICLRPIDQDARFSNLLLTMLQRMDVQTEMFSDSVGPIAELLA